jgi:hypothetical protein
MHTPYVTSNNDEAILLSWIRIDDLKVNTEKTMYMVMYRRLNSGQYHSLNDNKSFKNVANFKNLGTIITKGISFKNKE